MTWTHKLGGDGVYQWRANVSDADIETVLIADGVVFAANADGGDRPELWGGQWLGPLAIIDPDELTELRHKADLWDKVSGRFTTRELVEIDP